MISIMVEIFVQPLFSVCCAQLYFILRLSFNLMYFIFEVVVNGNFQSKVLLRKRNLMSWGNHCAPDPGASKPAKAL
jgi:hypothetical protein